MGLATSGLRDQTAPLVFGLCIILLIAGAVLFHMGNIRKREDLRFAGRILMVSSPAVACLYAVLALAFG